jgi:hypothetical protein
MAHYSGPALGALRYEDLKVYITEGSCGPQEMDFYNIKRQPGEKYGKLYPGVFAVALMQMLL